LQGGFKMVVWVEPTKQ